ncbi:S8 family peptidase [Halobacillus salinus]|uniref:S8 family peptidase n=1 Tax=Halobacillus salinus TaxID=192814 RepID=UPI00158FF6E4|nr:S8 family serine peptidase [Halobacillus salinus]
MKKYTGHLIIFVLLAVVSFPLATFAGEKEERMMIGFENSIDLTVLEGKPHQLIHTYDNINAISVNMDTSYINELRNTPKVAWVEKDRKVNATQQKKSWGYEATGVTTSNSLSLSGKGVKVAVIDTGIHQDHPDLNITGGVNFVGDGKSYEDDNGHGTHVAGIINAQDNEIGTVGVAPAAQLYAVKSLDADGIGNQTDVIAGIEWAIDHDVDIINLSLTSPYPSKTLKTMVDKAHDAGVFIVAASGNDRTGDGQLTDDVMFPGRYDNVISVGAVTEEKQKASYSYQGESLNFVAPGDQIYSTYIGQNSSAYTYLSGTSMSSPYVAGALALYQELYPEYTDEEIEELLIEQAEDLGKEGRDDSYGDGLVHSPTSYFTDITYSDWYLDFVDDLSEKEWITGYPDDTFRPEKEITRQEVVTLVGRSLDLDGKKRGTNFEDVHAWNYGSGFIDSAEDEGILTGYPDGTFRPNESITRGDVALIIYRAFDVEKSEGQDFKDVIDSRYYSEAIQSLAKEEILTGYQGGEEFKPENPITRAEFSTILSKTVDPELR